MNQPVANRGNLFFFTLFILAALAMSMLPGCQCYTEWSSYNKAEEAVMQEDWEKAYTLLESIPDADDPKGLRPLAIYGYADYLAGVKRYEEAVALFKQIPDHRNSKDRVRQTYQEWAEKLTSMKQYDQAIEIYKNLGEFGKAQQSKVEQADLYINQAKFEKALEALEGVEGERAEDLKAAAQKGVLYQHGMVKLDANDFTTARKIFQEAVKVRHEKRILLEDQYLKAYCEDLKEVVTRLGSEAKYVEVLKAILPVYANIQNVPSVECKACVNIGELAADRYFFAETSRADWHQKIDQYRKTFKDPTTRCNVFGGLIKSYLGRTKQLVNVLKAYEKIGGECNDAQAVFWNDSLKDVELGLSTMVLEWKNSGDFRQIIVLQKYMASKIKDIPMEIANWGALTEVDLRPEFKFTNTNLGKNRFLVAGWIDNPSNYRPLNLKGISIDCKSSTTNKVTAECVTAKVSDVILPGKKQTVNAPVKLPAGVDSIVDYKLLWEFEDVRINNVDAEDVFAHSKSNVIILEN